VISKPPWSDSDVRSINEWQADAEATGVNRMTCPDHGCTLVAHPAGLLCKLDTCGYIQTWCPDYMLLPLQAMPSIEGRRQR
jgi:hypothetical protein